MQKRLVTTCPDAEIVAAWVDQGLDAPERAAVAAHLADCDDCRMLVANVLRSTDAVRETLTSQEGQIRPLLVTRPARRQLLRWGGGALAAAAALLLVVRVQPEWLPFGPRDDAGSRLADLVKAVGEQRTGEGRLSGGFAYGPLRAPVRSGGSTAAEDNWSLLAAAARIREEAERQPVAANLHALGLAHLVRGQHDEAIRALEDATSEEPGSARFQNDLAAAYLARATFADRPEDLTRALTGAERAIKADAALLEARFNRALVLESLYLTDQARRAWLEYLEIDSASPWANEARQHLEKLRPADARPDLARNNSPPEVADTTVEAALDWMLQHGLPELADSILANDSSAAAAKRSSLLAYAESIARINGDPFPAALVPNVELTPTAAAAIVQMGKGLTAVQADDFPRADREFASACPVLGEPLGVLCGVHHARFVLHRKNRASANAYKDRALLMARRHGHAYLEGFALRFQGYSEAYSGNLSRALQPYRDAFAVFDRARYLTQMGFVANELANTLEFTGVVDEASRWRHISLRAAAETRVQRLDYVTRLSAASAFAARRQHEASRAFADAIGDSEASALSPLSRISRELQRAEASIALGDIQQARDAAEAARSVLDGSDDYRALSMRSVLLAELGEIAIAEERLEAADRMLTEAIELMGPERGIQRASAMLRRAAVRVRRAQPDLAEADVSHALAALAERASGNTWRPQHLDDAPAALEAIGELVASHQKLQGVRGLQLVESLRELLDGVPSHARYATPQVLQEAISQLGSGQAVLYYLFAQDRGLLAWVVMPGQEVTFTRLPVSSGEVVKLVNMLTVNITRFPEREDRWRSILAELYDRLLRAVPGLGSSAELVIVPDGVLNRVPFGALYDRSGGEYVFQQRAVRLASNLVLAIGSDRAPSSSAVIPSALVVGEPALTGSVDRQFGRLPRARLEATAIASLYPVSTLRLGEHATKAAILAAMGQRDVLHFAGHALAPARLSDDPRLLLAGPVEDPSSGLRASDLNAERGAMPRRVVLAACETGAAPIDRAAGVASLAAGFLRAGTTSVAATLWPVEDAASQEFFIALHRALVAGDSMARAVSRAQRACRSAERCRQAVTTWVGTTAYGSN